MADINLDSLLPSIGTLAAMGTLAVIVWNMSKTITTMKNDIVALRADHDKTVSDEKEKHVEDIKRLELQVSEAKSERLKQIGDIKLDLKDDFTAMQKQIDSSKADVKDMSGRINIINTKVDEHEREQTKLHERIDKNLSFITDWNQRIEDRHEKLREEFHRAIEHLRDSFVEMFSAFHGRSDKNNAS